jgi:hypothetical protein
MRIFLSLIMVVGMLVGMSSPAFAGGKRLTAGVSMNVRTNKKGQKVDLSRAPGYREAVVNFMNKRYGPAAAGFEKMDRGGFCCDLVHYYIAQCYDNLNQLQRAQLNYQWVSSYTKDPTLRVYSNYATQKLEYYAANRQYAGQGNSFDHSQNAPQHGVRGGGGGGGLC